MAYRLSIASFTEEDLEKLRVPLSETEGEILYLANKLDEFLDTIIEGHEETLVALEDPRRFKAFVDSLTVEDLQRAEVAPESVELFLRATAEDRLELIECLDIHTVYRLYESKPRTPLYVNHIQATERLRQELLSQLKDMTAPAGGLKPIAWIRQSEIAERAEAMELRRTASGQDIQINVTLEDIL